MKEAFLKMYRHMAWADRLLGKAVGAGEEVPAEAVRLYAHVVSAERVWLARLEGRDTAGIELFPEWDAAACVAASEEVLAGFGAYLAEVEDFERVAVYRNTKGTEFHTPVADILTHVFLHGSYHRGQINARLRGAGLEPVMVDYIAFVRGQG